jgi:hypothetical protein
MGAGILLVLGAVLCFAGAWSIRMTVLVAGFGAAWLLANALGASFGATLVIALGGAVVALLLTLVLSKLVLFVSGAAVGAVVGAELFAVLGGKQSSWVLAVVFVPAVAVVFGFLADKLERRFLIWATALGGAAMVLAGVGALGVSALHLFKRPDGAGQSILLAACWVVLAFLGRSVQLGLTRNRR